MKRILAGLSLLVCCIVAAPKPASAVINNITFVNKIDHSSWITIYTAFVLSKFSIHQAFCLQSGKNTERWLTDHRIARGNDDGFSEVKVRSEVKLRDDCAGPTISDTYDVNTSGSAIKPALANIASHTKHSGYYIVLKH